MLPAFYDSQINVCAFSSSLPIVELLQSFGFCCSLDVDFEQNNNDVAAYLLSISVCLSAEELNYV